jgi:hypothetical protein
MARCGSWVNRCFGMTAVIHKLNKLSSAQNSRQTGAEIRPRDQRRQRSVKVADRQPVQVATATPRSNALVNTELV